MRLIALALVSAAFRRIHAEASVPAHVHGCVNRGLPRLRACQPGSPLMRESVRNGESTKLGNICPNGYVYFG